MKTDFRFFFLWCFSLWALFSCKLPQRSLAIRLDETPLYSEQQWALINMPYIQVNQTLKEQNSALLGMLHFGSIVEVLRVESNPQSRRTGSLWAYVVQPQKTKGEIRGWVPYGFLYTVGSLTEARLVSRQMQKNNAVPQPNIQEPQDESALPVAN